MEAPQRIDGRISSSYLPPPKKKENTQNKTIKNIFPKTTLLFVFDKKTSFPQKMKESNLFDH